GARPELPVRSPGPIEVRRTVIGPWKRRGGALEQANRLGVMTLPVVPPPGLPGGPFGPRASGKLFVQLREDARRAFVVVLEDVVRAEIVQRFLGPRAVGELGDERARARHVLL